MSRRILVTVDDDLAAAIDRARGEVPTVEWIRNRLRDATSKPTSQASPTAPARESSAPRAPTPANPPANGKRDALRAALESVPRRMVPSQRAADPGETVLDYADAQG